MLLVQAPENWNWLEVSHWHPIKMLRKLTTLHHLSMSPAPRSQHTLPVTSLYLGMGEGGAVLVTASLDRSIKMWSLGTGQLLRGITLPAGVTSVTMDAGEHVVLAGCADGSIYEVSLVGSVEYLQAHNSSSGSSTSDVVGGPGSSCYEGHVKAISSLAITPDGEQLVSGRKQEGWQGHTAHMSCWAAGLIIQEVQAWDAARYATPGLLSAAAGSGGFADGFAGIATWSAAVAAGFAVDLAGHTTCRLLLLLVLLVTPHRLLLLLLLLGVLLLSQDLRMVPCVCGT